MGGQHPKHWHCAIYEPDESASLIPINRVLWEAYEEDRDLTRGESIVDAWPIMGRAGATQR